MEFAVYLFVILIQYAIIFAGIALLLQFFKPLLEGLLRASWLLLRPRQTREQRLAQGKLRDRRVLQKMINASSGPSHAAELQAMGARG